MNNKCIKKIKSYFWITLGVLILDIGYFFFLEPSKLCTGGVMGITIMIEDYLPFSGTIFMYILNIILLIIGLIMLGKDFFLKTAFASLLSPSIVFLFEVTKCNKNFFLQSVDSTNHLIISAIVGGVCSAIGLGICFRANATTGGMDVLQKIMAKYLHIPYSKTMYLTDWVIVLLSGFFIKNYGYYGIEGVVYGIICVIFVGVGCDYIALNAKSRRTAYIITTKPDEIKQMIFDELSRGCTVCNVKGGYTDEDKTMLICTLEYNQCYKLKDEIITIDPSAFTFMTQTKEIVGEYD